MMPLRLIAPGERKGNRYWLVRGWNVRHIGADGHLSEHRLTPFAVADGVHVRYPPAQQSLNLP